MTGMKTVANFPDLASAQLAKSLLESEGIEALIPDEHLAGIDWRLGTAIQGVRVQVDDEDAEEARGLLEGDDVAVDEEMLESADAIPAADLCPRCGSSETASPKWKRRLKAATLIFPLLIFAWPFLAAGQRLACTSCGHEWSPEES